ncbi:hypothetical protein [Rickettsia endosymbiont of Orchestes rusci]|nr:hypothetical protein [Rickettsia endosymbiont of Ceutorhynchus assimilis]
MTKKRLDSRFRALLHGSKINKKLVIASDWKERGNPGYPECNEGFN